MPTHILWGLKITNRQRILLAIAFCPGLVSIAASGKRLSIWVHQPKGSLNRNDVDSTWNRVDIYKLSNVEYCAALICASLPHLKPLVAKFIPEHVVEMTRFGRSHQRSDGNNKNQSGSSGTPNNSSRISGAVLKTSLSRLSKSFPGGEKKSIAYTRGGKKGGPYGNGGSEEFILHDLAGQGKGIHVQSEVEVTNVKVQEYTTWNERS